MPPPYAIRIYTASGGWQDIAITGARGAQGNQGPAGAVSVFEAAGDPGNVNIGSIWIDTDDTPVPGQISNPLGPAGGDLAGSYPNPTLAPLPYARWSWAGTLNQPASWINPSGGTFTASWEKPSGQLNLTNGRITVVRSGMYVLIGQSNHAANATGNRGVGVAVNGTQIVGILQIAAAATNTSTTTANGIWPLAAGDVVELQTYQSGTTVNLTGASLGIAMFGTS